MKHIIELHTSQESAVSTQILECSRINFKTFVLKLDNIRYYLNLAPFFDRTANTNVCFVFMVGLDFLVCQIVHQIQIIPDIVKFQSKGFEIKLIAILVIV